MISSMASVGMSARRRGRPVTAARSMECIPTSLKARMILRADLSVNPSATPISAVVLPRDDIRMQRARRHVSWASAVVYCWSLSFSSVVIVRANVAMQALYHTWRHMEICVHGSCCACCRNKYCACGFEAASRSNSTVTARFHAQSAPIAPRLETTLVFEWSKRRSRRKAF